MSKVWKRSAHALAIAAILAPALAGAAQAAPNLGRGALYVMTNDPAGNSVLVLRRDLDGGLTAAGSYTTGGLGNGTGVDPLRSQGGLVLSRGLLLAVNAGSNDLSVFIVGKQELTLVQRIGSGGTLPTSVAVWHDLVYVLNAGSGEITGFHIGAGGTLAPLAGSTRALTGGTAAAPSQVGFGPGGRTLVVTERGPQILDVFAIDEDGLAGAPVAIASHGAGPFGFAFDRRGTLVVSEAAAAAASSYRLGEDGAKVVSASVANQQKATCWLVVAGRHVFTANAGTSSISRYEIDGQGALALRAPQAALVDGTPLDMAIAGGGEFLYVSIEKTGAVAGFRIEEDGTLTPIATVSGLPPYFQGIAAQ